MGSLLFLIFLVFCLVLLLISGTSIRILREFRMARTEWEASQHWPSATAKIVSSDVEERVSGGGPRISVTRAMGKTYRYIPIVQYLYSVGDREFEGGRVFFGANIGFPERNTAVSVTRRHPEGKSVTVYYNPNSQAVSVLERDISNHYQRAARNEVFKLAGNALFIAAGFFYFLT